MPWDDALHTMERMQTVSIERGHTMRRLTYALHTSDTRYSVLSAVDRAVPWYGMHTKVLHTFVLHCTDHCTTVSIDSILQ